MVARLPAGCAIVERAEGEQRRADRGLAGIGLAATDLHAPDVDVDLHLVDRRGIAGEQGLDRGGDAGIRGDGPLPSLAHDEVMPVDAQRDILRRRPVLARDPAVGSDRTSGFPVLVNAERLAAGPRGRPQAHQARQNEPGPPELFR
ncbi:MAG: hypothetical protein E6K82_17460 [Candidatus Rokuibacteriota bacterium]|nr:MAG: hypothetical protein E6K82_17460 [Candidatus Rokubacteria bacterium]